MSADGLPWWAADLLRTAGNSRNGRARGSVSIVPGEAEVLVEGRGFRPSRVRLRAPVLGRRKWEAFFEVFATQALFPAALFAGYLPRSAKVELARRGVRLAPPRDRLSAHPAECPEDTRAGAIRLVANEVAADPFHLLRFRGADRDTILTGIAGRWKASRPSSRPAIPLEELQRILDRPPGGADAGSFLSGVQRAEAFRDDPVLRASLARLYVKVAERAAAAAARPVEREAAGVAKADGR